MALADEASDQERRRRKVYGRGLYDGLRMAGITNPEGFMNQSKLKQAEQGMTSIALKVLDCVPIQEPWDKGKIVAELRRTGSNCNVAIVEGCLNTLRGRGLIKEPERGSFVRAVAKAKVLEIVSSISTSSTFSSAATAASLRPAPLAAVAAIDQTQPSTKEKALPEAKKPVELRPRVIEEAKDPFVAMADIAKSAREYGQQLIALADKTEDAALQLQEDLDRIKTETRKFRQLQELLKGISS